MTKIKQAKGNGKTNTNAESKHASTVIRSSRIAR